MHGNRHSGLQTAASVGCNPGIYREIATHRDEEDINLSDLRLLLRVERMAQVTEVTVYRTGVASHSPEACQRLVACRPDVLTFTSSSTASNLVTLLGETEALTLAKSATVLSIGPVTTRTLKDLGLPVHVEAAEHTIDGLVRALVNTMTQDSTSG